jgi:pimeloyl-ACP methyl ester carboxylesterase
MAPRLVLVHGIGGPRRADLERQRWTAALADGARNAGHSAAAEQLADGTLADVVYAYYGDLFQRKQSQGTGDGELSAKEAGLLAELLAEVIEQHRSEPDVDQKCLDRAMAWLHPQDQAQGAMAPVKRAVDAATTLLDAGPWRAGGQWISGKLMVGDLAQVARYLARGEADPLGHSLDQRIRAVVTEAFGPGPAVVVAHSLGTVVSFETLHEHPGEVSLWVTLGSPLAMRSVVWPKLRPAPPATPPQVRRWLNYWDRDDVVAARPILEKSFLPNTAGVLPDSDRVDSDGVWVHAAVKYLAKADVAGPIMEALQSLAPTR